MGKIKYLNFIRQFFKETPIVTTRDLRLIVKNNNYVYLLVHNLIKTGEIKKVKKGFYTTHDDPIVSVFCFKPAYIGLQSALSIHDIWEQETNTVIVTAKNVRIGVKNIFGNNVVIHRIKSKLLFGYNLIKYNDFYIPVSDLEKTFLDLIYFNEIPDKEVLRKLKKLISKEKVKQYLKPYPENIRKKVSKYL